MLRIDDAHEIYKLKKYLMKFDILDVSAANYAYFTVKIIYF